MRKFLIVIGLLALATSAAAQESGARPRGAVLVQRFCAGCHAVGARGASPNPAAPAFRELHRRYSIESLAEALAEGMLVGHPAMPEFDFDPEDVKAIVTYLKSIQTNQDASLPHRPAP
jgi:mono/diheme cytochrome c family protein